MARANAKPNIPTAGPKRDPLEAASTKREPMIGPVQEKLTKLSVNAIKDSKESALIGRIIRLIYPARRQGDFKSTKDAAKITKGKERQVKPRVRCHLVEFVRSKMTLTARPSAT